MSQPEPLMVVIGDHLFKIRVPVEDRPRCARAEAETNERLTEIAGGGGLSGPRALAMLAFEISVELQEAYEEIGRLRRHGEGAGERIGQIIQKIDSLTTGA